MRGGERRRSLSRAPRRRSLARRAASRPPKRVQPGRHTASVVADFPRTPRSLCATSPVRPTLRSTVSTSGLRSKRSSSDRWPVRCIRPTVRSPPRTVIPAGWRTTKGRLWRRSWWRKPTRNSPAWSRSSRRAGSRCRVRRRWRTISRSRRRSGGRVQAGTRRIHATSFWCSATRSSSARARIGTGSMSGWRTAQCSIRCPETGRDGSRRRRPCCMMRSTTTG